jgi:hypothetical protein
MISPPWPISEPSYAFFSLLVDGPACTETVFFLSFFFGFAFSLGVFFFGVFDFFVVDKSPKNENNWKKY